MIYYLSIGLTIISCLFYQLIQKNTPSNVNPLISLMVSYTVAIILCVLLLPFFSRTDFIQSVKELNWASYLLGPAILGIEVGYLLAYRAGWNISIGSTFANVVVGLLLIPIGLLFFKETLSVPNIVGFIFCLIGLVLLSYHW